VSVNRAKPHALVLPEDDANRQIANGFELELPMGTSRQFQILPIAGGWREVLAQFKADHIAGMNTYPNRSMIFLLDFDDQPDRRDDVMREVPDHLRHRVFLLGVNPEPEDLRRDLGSYETIGRNLAIDCRDGTNITWQHRRLSHNAAEVSRLRQQVQSILF
jgi:hypothetical protein